MKYLRARVLHSDKDLLTFAILTITRAMRGDATTSTGRGKCVRTAHLYSDGKFVVQPAMAL